MGRRLPEFLRPNEADAMVHAATSPRDRLLLLIGLGSGLRCSEIVHLRIEHIDLARSTIFVCQGKGAKDGYVPIPPFLCAGLRDWIGERREGWIFPGRKPGKPLTTRTVQLVVGRIRKAAGIVRRCSPHTLRHSLACELLRSGATLVEIQTILRHSNLATTAVYLHCDTSTLKSAVDRLGFCRTPPTI